NEGDVVRVVPGLDSARPIGCVSARRPDDEVTTVGELDHRSEVTGRIARRGRLAGEKLRRLSGDDEIETRLRLVVGHAERGELVPLRQQAEPEVLAASPR